MFLIVGPAVADPDLEIRGLVYNGAETTGINVASKMDATQFAAFFYDIYNGVITEQQSN